jgi:hypothetical protein
MIGIFGPRFEKGATVERIDNGDRATLTADRFGDYIGVKWERDGTTAWVRCSLLRLVPVTVN